MRKITLLLGAGAALPWGAPSTAEITESIKNSNDHTVDDVPLGEWMNNILNGNINRNTVNFENYIDFIESVYSHLISITTAENPALNLSNGIFTLKEEVAEGIKKMKWSNNSSFSSDISKVTSTYYSMIRIVRNQISKYLSSYEQKNLELNNEFRIFCEHFISLGFSLRAYSLNYDRSIPLIFENSPSKHEIFDGFNISNRDSDELLSLNKYRILSDTECNSFYNLHGSFHWRFQGPPYVIKSSRKYKYFPENPDVAEYPIHSNPNEKILQSSIITGFRKTQRINVEPYNYLFHNFFRDVQDSNLVIVIGYSYSDPHINQLINEAIRNKTRIYNVTSRNLSIAMKDHGYGSSIGTILKNAYPDYTDWFQSGGNYYSEYPKGFESFLKWSEWLNIQPL